MYLKHIILNLYTSNTSQQFTHIRTYDQGRCRPPGKCGGWLAGELLRVNERAGHNERCGGGVAGRRDTHSIHVDV